MDKNIMRHIFLVLITSGLIGINSSLARAHGERDINSFSEGLRHSISSYHLIWIIIAVAMVIIVVSLTRSAVNQNADTVRRRIEKSNNDDTR